MYTNEKRDPTTYSFCGTGSHSVHLVQTHKDRIQKLHINKLWFSGFFKLADMRQKIPVPSVDDRHLFIS
jgi:hypothetical protein